ncbi:MAG: septal ring lytic transglycosylase RlpA family protein [Desulfobacterales bacterium]|nr:MAG: septal ring lytic transglycosylase RlpA family protein [Desulfobacterales bacterium]
MDEIWTAGEALIKRRAVVESGSALYFVKKREKSYDFLRIVWVVACLYLASCGVVKTTYRATKGTVKLAYTVTKFAGKTVYTVGKFTFKVVMAPLTWPLIREDLESIDDLPPKEAIQQGRVKMSPYVVNGRRYVPMSVAKAKTYREKGIASWYGYETYRQKGGHMTANGEAFDPNGFNAAHKYLPLPTFVRITNLENRRRIVVRVNDRGPFVKGRIIDLSAGAAKKLGFFKKGTARVLVETVNLEG